MQLVTRDYQGFAITYQDDGWFNATQAAGKWGKRPIDWLRLDETTLYIAALASALGVQSKVSQAHFGFVKSSRGGKSPGTWMHPKLAVRFSQWLDPHFAVWCDTQIDGLIRLKDDWRKLRHSAASSTKVQDAMLQEVRKAVGKATEAHHCQLLQGRAVA